jgi:hypothetical protein
MGKDTAWAIGIGSIYLAILYMLVRPASKGPTIVSNVFDALSDLVKGTTGYTA